MDLLFIIAFFVLLVGIIAYTLATHFATSRAVKGSILIVSLIITVPLLALGLIALFDGSSDATTKMWALGTVGIIGAFWFKNPIRDFDQG